MNLEPYLEGVRRDLTAAAAPGGPELTRSAELLTGALDAALRLCLIEALSDASAEITTKLDSAAVEVRMRGRDADLVVTRATEPASAPAPAPADAGADLARITLRLPEALKEQVEQAAATEGISVNAWLVRAISTAVSGGGARSVRVGPGRGRVTGFAQA